jgi:pectin methylesterase-like acyl-CoA thioesterase
MVIAMNRIIRCCRLSIVLAGGALLTACALSPSDHYVRGASAVSGCLTGSRICRSPTDSRRSPVPVTVIRAEPGEDPIRALNQLPFMH